jgi:hypothetical protein
MSGIDFRNVATHDDGTATTGMSRQVDFNSSQSPKTINASGTCQDQSKEDSIHLEGEVPHPSIHHEHQHLDGITSCQ